MNSTVKLVGRYVKGWGSASGNWKDDIVQNQKKALPSINEMHKGTFNLRLIDPTNFVPADIEAIRKLKNGSCISKTTKVRKINNVRTEAFIYNGGWPSNTIELISRTHIARHFDLNLNDTVTIELEIDD